MTVHLDTDTSFHDDEPALLGPLSILAINIVCCFGVVAGTYAAGLPLGIAVVTGWLGGAAMTLCAVAVLIALLPVAARRTPAQLQLPRTEVVAARSTLLDWVEDSEAEDRAAARRHLVQSWCADAAAERTRERTAA